MNATIQNHLEARRLESRPAADAEVLGFWEKALVAYQDAGNTSSSLDNRLIRAYDSARIAALSIVRCAGYRTRGGDGHHYVTFDVARSVVIHPDLRRALDDMNALRKERHAVEYEAENTVSEDILASAVRHARVVISLGAAHLRAERPAIEARIRSI